METREKKSQPAALPTRLDGKPIRKVRGPSMKKKVIYLQSRLCYIGVP